MAGNAKKFNLKDLLNERSKEAAVQQPEEDQTIIVEGEQTTALLTGRGALWSSTWEVILLLKSSSS